MNAPGRTGASQQDRSDMALACSGPTPALSRNSVWIFDLDNTLYPAECNLFAQVDQRMGEFIANHLGVPFEYARHLQKSYYRQFGTTLAGLDARSQNAARAIPGLRPRHRSLGRT